MPVQPHAERTEHGASDAEELDRLRREVDRLNAELTLAELRTVAAVAVAQLIGDCVEDDEDLCVVAADIAECWQRLPASVREAYVPHRGSVGLAQFAGDYSMVVNCAWRSGDDGPHAVRESEADLMCRMSWQIRVAQIVQRLTLNAPPDPAWLEQFPTPEVVRANDAVTLDG